MWEWASQGQRVTSLSQEVEDLLAEVIGMLEQVAVSAVGVKDDLGAE
jgi:hypothetical protein